jgi:LmbE family N-acetylglucosaminyl deacetylase
MLQLPLLHGDQPLVRVLALGCHADDIEIGCGATLLTLTRAHPRLEVTWVVLGAVGEREREARSSAAVFLAAAARGNVIVHDFRDGFFPYSGDRVKEAFEALKNEVDPQLIFTHARDDLHQDHRLACELTWNTFRDHLILEYEIPKYDGDLGRPNTFVPVSKDVAEEKARLVVEQFGTQRDRHWFDADLFLGLMRVRGVEAHSATRYAEAFTCRKLCFAVNDL